eukprot:bmy_20473T0
MADKLDMREIVSFDKAKLKKTEMQEKNTLQAKFSQELLAQELSHLKYNSSILGPQGTGLYATSDLLYQVTETKISSKEHPIPGSINLKRRGHISNLIPIFPNSTLRLALSEDNLFYVLLENCTRQTLGKASSIRKPENGQRKPDGKWQNLGGQQEEKNCSKTRFQGRPKATPPRWAISSSGAVPLVGRKAAALSTESPGRAARTHRASAVRMSHLYKEMLTVQVLLLGAHHFVSGGFAHRSGYSGACHAVLSGGDPIRERLARHLLRPRLPPPLLREKGEDGPALSRRPDPPSTQALPPPAAWRLSSPSPPRYHLPGASTALSPARTTRSRRS